MAKLLGKWTFNRNENISAMLKAIGLAENLRTAIENWKPNIEIQQSEGVWTIRHVGGVGLPDMDLHFRLGQEFERPTPTGKNLLCTITLEGDKMVELQKNESEDVLVIREVEGDEMKVTMTSNGVTGTSYFKKA